MTETKVQLIGGPLDGTTRDFNTSCKYLEIPIEAPMVADPPCLACLAFGPTLQAIGRYEFDGAVLRWVGQRPLWDGISDTVEEFR